MSATIVFAALCCAAAVWLVMPAGGQTRRLEARSPRHWPPWVQGRPGAPGLKLRAAAGLAGSAVPIVLIGGGAGWALALPVALATFVAGGRLELSGPRLQRELVEEQLPDTLELMSGALGAGAPLRGATAQVSQVAPEPTRSILSRITASTQAGMSDADAWRAVGSADLDGSTAPWRAVGADVALSAESGVGLADLFARHAEDARRRRRIVLQRRARTVAVRSVVPLMCCFLPAFLLVGVLPIILGTVLKSIG